MSYPWYCLSTNLGNTFNDRILHPPDPLRGEATPQSLGHPLVFLAFGPDNTPSRKPFNERNEVWRFGIFARVNISRDDMGDDRRVCWDELASRHWK